MSQIQTIDFRKLRNLLTDVNCHTSAYDESGDACDPGGHFRVTISKIKAILPPCDAKIIADDHILEFLADVYELMEIGFSDRAECRRLIWAAHSIGSRSREFQEVIIQRAEVDSAAETAPTYGPQADDLLLAQAGLAERFDQLKEVILRNPEEPAPDAIAAARPDEPQAVRAPEEALASLLDETMMNHREIANSLTIDAERLRKALERWRGKHGDGWQEAANPHPHEPKYLYRIGAVRPVLQRLI